jgi:quercetin dioxygenase-like cupin family protein
MRVVQHNGNGHCTHVYYDDSLKQPEKQIMKLSIWDGEGGHSLSYTSPQDIVSYVVRGRIHISAANGEFPEAVYRDGEQFDLPAHIPCRFRGEPDSIIASFTKRLAMKDLEVIVIRNEKRGYTKWLFRNIGLPDQRETSFFLWEKNAESPDHDHSVDENTHIVRGRMVEFRYTGKGIIGTAYAAGQEFLVPRGTRHTVKALEESKTVNYCHGRLEMNVFLQPSEQLV